MKIFFRKCKKEDVRHAVPLIYSSGPAAFDYVFQTSNKSATDFLKFAFLKNQGEFSYKTHTAVIDNDKIIGIGASFGGESTFKFTLAAIFQIFQFYKWLAFQVLYRGLQVEKIIQPPKKGEVAIAHLGVQSAYRGKGIGTKLVSYLLKENKNYSKAILDVTEINPAIKLYKKLGFEIAAKNNSSLIRGDIKVPHHFRMKMSFD